MTPDRNSVYEVVDTTNDETYWSLGMFLSLESAIAAIEACDSPWNLSPMGNDYGCAIEIRERAIGWSGMGKSVWQREWVERFDEELDESIWEVKECKTTA